MNDKTLEQAEEDLANLNIYDSELTALASMAHKRGNFQEVAECSRIKEANAVTRQRIQEWKTKQATKE